MQTLSSNSTQQGILDELHRQFLVTKISHYHWKSLAKHTAFGRTYDDLDALVDTLTEQLIGWTGAYPSHLTIGKVEAITPEEAGKALKELGKKIEKYAEEKGYCSIENLAQELSGIGAQLCYLAPFQ